MKVQEQSNNLESSLPGMVRRNENGSVGSFVAIFALAAALLGMTIFAFWSFSSRQDYKNNSDQKVADAVNTAKQTQEAQLQAQFQEQEKKPTRNYKGPTTYGTVSFDYPKTWSAYIDDSNSSEPINGYFYPLIVPSLNGKNSYALRVELVATDYSSAVHAHDSQIKDGSAKATAYIPPKMVGVKNVQPGTRIDGVLDQDTNGSMVIIQVRDKTLQIYTESKDFAKDFDDIVLSSLTFAP